MFFENIVIEGESVMFVIVGVLGLLIFEGMFEGGDFVGKFK